MSSSAIGSAGAARIQAAFASANAAGRLVGTLLSGVLYLWGGLDLALSGSAAFVAITWSCTMKFWY